MVIQLWIYYKAAGWGGGGEGLEPVSLAFNKYFIFNRGMFWIFWISMYCIQYCFICRPSDSTVSENVGIEPRTSCDFGICSQTLYNHSARSHPHWLDFIIDFRYRKERISRQVSKENFKEAKIKKLS